MTLQLTAQEIANLLGGKVEGDTSVVVSNFAKIEEAQAGELTFLANPKYEHYLYSTRASIVLVSEDFAAKEAYTTTLVRVADAYSALAQLMQVAEQAMHQRPQGIHPRATIAEGVDPSPAAYIGAGAIIEEGVRLGQGVYIYPNSYIGKNCTIGDGSIIYPNVTLYHNTQIGKRCIIHAGAVIGADGFGFAPQLDGYHKIPQLGSVLIEDDVEIGANSCIDRAVMGVTRIGQGAKLDNLVQIAHNCEVGKHTVMAAQGGMAGSSKIGAWCQTGGQVGIAGHLEIGDRVQLGGQTGIIGNVESGKTLMGSPAMDARSAMRVYALMQKLPEIYRSLGAIEKDLENIKTRD